MVEQAKEVAKEAQTARISALQGVLAACFGAWQQIPFRVQDRVQALRIHSRQFVSFQAFSVKVLDLKLPDL